MKISLEKSKELPEINISLSKAKFEKLFYFVVTGVIYHQLKKCLILQRSKKEATHPGLWGVIGKAEPVKEPKPFDLDMFEKFLDNIKPKKLVPRKDRDRIYRKHLEEKYGKSFS